MLSRPRRQAASAPYLARTRPTRSPQPCSRHWHNWKGMTMKEVMDKGLLREQYLIAGKCLNAASGASLAVTDPATQSVIGTVPDVSVAQTRTAIEAASAG